MLITFGKHNRKSTELVILKVPDYVKWVLDNREPSGPLLAVQKDFIRLIGIFDSKPLQNKCFKCKEPATKFSFYQGNIDPYYWCDKCDPYFQGAMPGKLSIVTSYRQALNFVVSTCQGRESDFKDIIRNISVAKGLQGKISEKLAQSFFV
jgi:hypothetical protein